MIKVFKIGGNVIDNPEMLERFTAEFAAIPGPKVLIHGGGAIASKMQKELGMQPLMIGGRRVTDADTLRIVSMVYAGLTNKTVVALLQKNNCNALGLSGADGDVIRSHKRPPVFSEAAGEVVDYGFVGDVDKVDGQLLMKLIDADIVPVICAITHDGNGQLLNTNADTVAQSVATEIASLAPAELIYCFEKNGVLADPEDDNSVIAEINPESFAALKADGTVSGGMLPKLENAFKAINAGVKRVVIKHAANILTSLQTDIVG